MRAFKNHFFILATDKYLDSFQGIRRIDVSKIKNIMIYLFGFLFFFMYFERIKEL